ncbi:hypothetical protein S7711_04526, partial [Stachybotrys chartarum IBT 7711]
CSSNTLVAVLTTKASHEDNPGDVSDADSDLELLQGEISTYDQSVRSFLASHHNDGASFQPTRGGPRGRGARGPRKAAKPRGDITARLSKVNQAFLGGDYSRALDLAFEVIRINAETHQAWTAVASIFREQGEMDRALAAMVYAAHLRPKDLAGWMNCASFALDTVTDDEAGNLHTARLCFSAAIRADPTNIDARLGKAAVCHSQGHLSAAISEYNMVLRRRPQDLDLVRKLAEACVDNKHAETALPSAIAAYRRYFDIARANTGEYASDALWHDIGIYVELHASTGCFQDATHELKALSRWLVGRAPEAYWDEWQADDREWDNDHGRRLLCPDFVENAFPLELYGYALPLELRVRLAIYRLRLGDEAEAFHHLSWLESTDQHTIDFIADFSFLAYDLASELMRCGQPSFAIPYFEKLRHLPGDPDPAVLLQLGRCYLATGEQSTAEEYFLASIEADEEIIDARIELANLYERTREDEEALILAAEAMALREAHDAPPNDPTRHAAAAITPAMQPLYLAQRTLPIKKKREPRSKPSDGQPKSVIPRRYRPKRLAGADRRQQDEQARAGKLAEQYRIVRNLKQQINDGNQDLVEEWMTSSRELVDEFRSLKKFYSWDKYLRFLGRRVTLEQQDPNRPESELTQMYERLSRSLAPRGDLIREGQSSVLDHHQGISFDSWLDLFLDYAIGLAVNNRRDEAYQICEAARDSTVFQSPKYEFPIYIAWSVCAIYTSDEEKCVTIGRHLMRDGGVSDSYRMFALLSYLCQSPVSWYTSGPAQKYILRQIKAVDSSHPEAVMRGTSGEHERRLDVCLLMLYGHILFTSTSYTHALGYFLRARSLDPGNSMVNLSLGLAYVHYGLKRQSTNRQYLLLQGQAFLTQYAEGSRLEGGPVSSVEAYYNIARLFQLLGIGFLAHEYYTRATEEIEKGGGDDNIKNDIATNQIISLLSSRNRYGALLLMKQRMKL